MYACDRHSYLRHTPIGKCISPQDGTPIVLHNSTKGARISSLNGVTHRLHICPIIKETNDETVEEFDIKEMTHMSGQE